MFYSYIYINIRIYTYIKASFKYYIQTCTNDVQGCKHAYMQADAAALAAKPPKPVPMTKAMGRDVCRKGLSMKGTSSSEILRPIPRAFAWATARSSWRVLKVPAPRGWPTATIRQHSMCSNRCEIDSPAKSRPHTTG